MPISCATGTTALTGSDGLVMLSPAGTNVCLQDNSDFPAGTDITVGSGADYHIGDPIVFHEEQGGKLDTALTASTTYYVLSVSSGKIKVAASKTGAAITLNGDGGTAGSGVASLAATAAGVGYANGTFNNVSLKQGVNVSAKATVTVTGGVPAITAITTPGSGYTTTAGSISLTGGTAAVGGAAIDAAAPTTPYAGTATLTTGSDSAGHINVSYSLDSALCGVKEWSLELSRDSIDVTTLPCKIGGASKYAAFKSSLGGFASGEGSMTVMMTRGTSQINRILSNSLYKNSVAKVKLYLEAGVTSGSVDDSISNYIEADVSLQGFSTGVNVDDAVECEIQFSLLGTPDVLFGVKL